MPSISTEPPQQALKSALVSAASFYAKAKQGNMMKTKLKSKKKNKTAANIKKLLSTKTSPTVSESIKLYVQSAVDGKASKAKHSTIVQAKTPTLAKPDGMKIVSSTNFFHISSSSQGKKPVKRHLQEPSDMSSSDKNSSSESSSGNGKPKKSKKFSKALKATSKIEKASSVENVHSGMNEKPTNVKKIKKSAPAPPETAAVNGYKKNVSSKKKPTEMKRSNPVTKLLHNLEDIEDTRMKGLKALSYLVAPYDASEFFNNYWEKKHLLIKRKNSQYLDGLFSTKTFDKIIRNDFVEYTKNLDITSYSDGERQTHNPVGRVYPPVVWDYFSNGCSLRLLNPQTFHKPVWSFLAALQDYMGAFCGANVYLTPSETQGFAPHWDDIEAFILQLEGKKRWRVYKPRNKDEVLPRYSSPNMTQEEIGDPILDVILEEGDMLYFPRGYIHQAEAVPDTHSLHITISTYQKTAWVDLMEKMFSTESLARVAASSEALRGGLPRGYLNYMGMMSSEDGPATASKSKKMKRSNSDSNRSAASSLLINKKRKEFKEKIVSLMVKTVLNDATIDCAVDAMARDFVRVALPPPLSEDERYRTVVANGEKWGPNGVEGRVEVDPSTRVRLIGSNALRVVLTKAEWRVYHSVANSREYEGRPEQYIVLDEKHLPAVRHLMAAYPRYTTVEDLPLPVLEDNMVLAMALWEQHLLVTEDPLFEDDADEIDCCCSDDHGDDSDSAPSLCQ